MKKLLIVMLAMIITLFFIACLPPETQKYTLTINTSGEGTVILSPAGGTYDVGTVVTLTATPADNSYEFTGWSGDLSGQTNPITITMNANKTVSADFTLKTFTNEWLIMMYIDGDCNLERLLWVDLGEIEKGLYNLQQSNPTLYAKVKVVALWDGHPSSSSFGGYTAEAPTGSKLYELGPDTSENTTLSSNTVDVTSTGGDWISSGEVNMGSGATVTSYLNWAKTNYTDFRNYVFILSNHGGGPEKKGDTVPIVKSICWDETSGDDYLSTNELEQAISSAGFTGGNKLNILGMDACLMGNIEEAYEYRNVTKYFVASPQSEQGDGWEYGNGNSGYGWIDHIVDGMSASELSIVMAQSYQSNFSGDQTMTAVDLSQIEALKSAVDALGDAINNAGASARSAAKTVMNNTYRYDSYFPWLREFGEFCIDLAASTNTSITQDIKNAAVEAGDSLGNAVLWAYGPAGNGGTPSFSGTGVSHKRGLSIVSSNQSFYSTLDFYGGGWTTLLTTW